MVIQDWMGKMRWQERKRPSKDLLDLLLGRNVFNCLNT